MTREDERERWRREDERRDYGRQEYQRLEYDRRDRDREYWRDQDLQDEDRRQDRLRDERERSEQTREAWRSLRGGDTAWALRNLAGPDAAIQFLSAASGSSRGSERENVPAHEDVAEPAHEPKWPPHGIVHTLAQLVENVAAAPPAILEVSPPDKDGDVLVRAMVTDAFLNGQVASMWTAIRGGVPYRREHGKFWVASELLAALSEAVASLERTRTLIGDLETYTPS